MVSAGRSSRNYPDDASVAKMRPFPEQRHHTTYMLQHPFCSSTVLSPDVGIDVFEITGRVLSDAERSHPSDNQTQIERAESWLS